MNIDGTSCVLLHIYAHVNKYIKMQAPLRNIEHGRASAARKYRAGLALSSPLPTAPMAAPPASHTCHAMCGEPGAAVGVQEPSSRLLRLGFVCVCFISFMYMLHTKRAHTQERENTS